MRLFTAVDIPPTVRNALSKMIDRLRVSAKVSWSDPEKLHITTKFIGEWKEDRLEELESVLGAVRSPGAIQVDVKGLGWFPDARHPHTLWAGVDASPELAALAHATELALQPIGIAPEERKFSPHLTLARIRDHAKCAGLRASVTAMGAPDFGSFSPDRFHLYLSKDGKYTRMAEFPLT